MATSSGCEARGERDLGGKAELDVKLIQLVRLLRNGEPFKMSKRAGDIVLSRDVVIGSRPRRACAFMMLYRKN